MQRIQWVNYPRHDTLSACDKTRLIPRHVMHCCSICRFPNTWRIDIHWSGYPKHDSVVYYIITPLSICQLVSTVTTRLYFYKKARGASLFVFLSPSTLFVTLQHLFFILWNMASTTLEKDVATVGLIRSNGHVKTKDACSTDSETVCESIPEWAICNRLIDTTLALFLFSSPTYIDCIGFTTGMVVLCSCSNQLWRHWDKCQARYFSCYGLLCVYWHATVPWWPLYSTQYTILESSTQS